MRCRADEDRRRSPATARKDVVLVVLAQTVQEVGSHAVGFRAARQFPGEDPGTRAALLAAWAVVFNIGLGFTLFCLLGPIGD